MIEAEGGEQVGRREFDQLFATKQRSDAGATAFQRDSESVETLESRSDEAARREPAERVRLKRH